MRRQSIESSPRSASRLLPAPTSRSARPGVTMGLHSRQGSTPFIAQNANKRRRKLPVIAHLPVTLNEGLAKHTSSERTETLQQRRRTGFASAGVKAAVGFHAKPNVHFAATMGDRADSVLPCCSGVLSLPNSGQENIPDGQQAVNPSSGQPAHPAPGSATAHPLRMTTESGCLGMKRHCRELPADSVQGTAQ